MRRIVALLISAVTASFALSAPVLAWGLGGHTMIGQAAMAHLPDGLPAFLRTDAAKDDIIYLQSEEDRLKLGEGDEQAWTREWTTDHYIDIGDDGKVGGAFSIAGLPATRDDFDLALAKASIDPYNVGFLPYAIIEGYEQVRTDFALWRMAPDAASKSKREMLAIHDIGIFSHFVGDGSQPLHVSIHFNGWGKYPNPNGYSDSKTTHADFEEKFVDQFVKLRDVSALVGSARVLSAIPMTEIEQYLQGTDAQVVPFYELKKAGAFDLSGANPVEHAKGVDFTAHQIARASVMLNSLILTAWRTSAAMKPVD